MSTPRSIAELKLEYCEQLAYIYSPALRYADGEPIGSMSAVRARLVNELRAWAHSMALSSEYPFERGAIFEAVGQGADSIGHFFEDKEKLKRQLEKDLKRIRAAVLSYPDEPLGTVFPRRSPFDYYRWLHTECASARAILIYSDPYPSADTFHRYLRNVDSAVAVTILTQEPGKPDKRWNEFLSVSRVFGEQRKNTYTLKVDTLHDRHLRVDDRAYHIGGSSKDGATKDDTTVTVFGVDQVDAIVGKGREIFGRAVTKHP